MLKFSIKHIKLNTPFLFLGALCLFISCTSRKNIEASQSIIESEPKIIFLNYSIKKTSDSNRSIQFINKIVTDGAFKNSKSNETGVSGDLICFQLDKKSNILQRIIVKNPLSKSIEYMNESKSFSRKQIDLESTQFSIRLQLNPNTKYISITDFSTFDNPEKPIVKTQVY